MKIKYLFIYDHETFLGCVTFPNELFVSVGEEITVNFDDSEIGFREGLWKRPEKTYTFPINHFGNLEGSSLNGNSATTQLASHEHEDD